jgi:phosphatidylinositol alpha-mannosyltransferase
MKIGLICPYNVARGGAVQEIVKDMQVGLSKRGHTVKIITGRPRDISGIDTTNMMFVGKVTDFKSPTHTLASFTLSGDAEADARAIETEKFDVLHFHEPGLPLIGKQMLDRSTSVNVATFHAKLPDTIMSKTIAKVVTPYLRSILDDLDELTVGSESAADYIRTLTDRPLHYIPNGVDLEMFKPVPRHAPGDHKKILFIGRLEHRKGVKYLLRAFEVLSRGRDDVELIIAGDGPDREKLELQAADLNLKHVTFMGYIDHATKLRLLAEADLFCSPAIFGESFGLVLLEAMATGLVTVAGDNPGYAGVMRDRGILSLVNPHDTADFARRLELLLENEDLRKSWRTWALEYVKQYDYRKIMIQYEAQYEQALKNRKQQNRMRPADSP